ncbi:MAG: succinate dehydrogenase, cytochrome b556 subunit [Hyphomicrobiales bacterium]|nr:MAG: succinate dehydrogenase, cytochrome b556 subunit [Hyphomicrobiales bacterium]
MADAKPAVDRPLSPHLSIYRFQINMLMSILHRITGAANYFGSAFLAAWLLSAAVGRKEYDSLNALLTHPIGMLLVFGYTWSVIHHMVGGVRHLIWDTGRGLTIGQVNSLSWLTLTLSLALTCLVWAVGLISRGVIAL